MTVQAPFERATVVRNTALLLGCVILFGLTLRTLIAQDVEPIAASIGGLCAVLLFYVRAKVGAGAPAGSGAVMVMGIAILVFTAIAWLSHGFRGSIIFAAPMIPLVASLMMDKRGVRNVTVITACILLFLLTQHLTGTLQPDESFPEEIRYAMRAIILLLSLVGVAWITSYYSLLQTAEPAVAEEVDDKRDPLTGLLSRAAVDAELEKEFARARRREHWISLAVIEVDDFAGLESEYGPQGGQNCLLGVAEGLRYCMRRSTDSLGRWGAQQLCIVMGDTDIGGAAKVGEKFRTLIQTLDIPVDQNRTVLLNVSVGVSSAQGRSLAGVVDLVETAEAALAKARSEGGNRVVGMDISVQEPTDA